MAWRPWSMCCRLCHNFNAYNYDVMAMIAPSQSSNLLDLICSGEDLLLDCDHASHISPPRVHFSYLSNPTNSALISTRESLIST